MPVIHAYIASALIPVSAQPDLASAMRRQMRAHAVAMLLEEVPCTEREGVKITVSIARDDALSNALGPFMVAKAEAACPDYEGCSGGD